MDKYHGLLLSDQASRDMCRHAEDSFPEECCGVVLIDDKTDYIQRLNNIQNQLHALDPQTYPRTAAIAYAMDPKELERVIDNAALNGAKLKAFYHSHPDHKAYFSEEDKAFASPFGEPTFPETAQIVISIYNREVKDVRAYAWSEEHNDFIEFPLENS
ncbi:MAG: M67 family metallopeptidase [Candidatus Binatia bacterium]